MLLNDVCMYVCCACMYVCMYVCMNVCAQHYVETYSQAGLLLSQGDTSLKALPPHVFAIADQAYRDMVKEDYESPPEVSLSTGVCVHVCMYV